MAHSGITLLKKGQFWGFRPTHEFIREGSDFQIFAPSGPGDDVSSMIEILALTFDWLPTPNITLSPSSLQGVFIGTQN